MNNKLVTSCLIAVMGFTSLTGCASKYGTQLTHPECYPECYEPIHQLRDKENNVAKGAGVGAAVGCASGTAVGLIKGKKWQDALVGCLAGGIMGAAIGAYYEKRQVDKDTNVRMAAYIRDLDGDISNLNIETVSAQRAIECYKRRFDEATVQFKKGLISREDYGKKYHEISSGMREAQMILGENVATAQKIDQQYNDAFAKEGYINPNTVYVQPQPDTSSKYDPQPNTPPKNKLKQQKKNQVPTNQVATATSTYSNSVEGKYASYKKSINNAKQTNDEAAKLTADIEKEYKTNTEV